MTALLTRRSFAQGELLAKEVVDRLQRADFAVVELVHRVVETFEHPWHLQSDQVLAHLIEGARPSYVDRLAAAQIVDRGPTSPPILIDGQTHVWWRSAASAK